MDQVRNYLAVCALRYCGHDRQNPSASSRACYTSRRPHLAHHGNPRPRKFDHWFWPIYFFLESGSLRVWQRPSHRAVSLRGPCSSVALADGTPIPGCRRCCHDYSGTRRHHRWVHRVPGCGTRGCRACCVSCFCSSLFHCSGRRPALSPFHEELVRECLCEGRNGRRRWGYHRGGFHPGFAHFSRRQVPSHRGDVAGHSFTDKKSSGASSHSRGRSRGTLTPAWRTLITARTFSKGVEALFDKLLGWSCLAPNPVASKPVAR